MVYSVILNEAPVCGYTFELAKANMDAIMRVQHRVALCSCCPYRQVSYTASNLVSAMPPIDLLVLERIMVDDRSKTICPVSEDREQNDTHTLKEVTLDIWDRRL